MSLIVNKSRRDQLIRRFSRLIAKSTSYLESIEIDHLCQVSEMQHIGVDGIQDVRVDFEDNTLDRALMQQERINFRKEIAALSKTVEISNGAEEFYALMDEVFDVLDMPGWRPSRKSFERLTGLKLIRDGDLCDDSDSDIEIYDVGLRAWVVHLH